jgi:hypothetical protein
VRHVKYNSHSNGLFNASFLQRRQVRLQVTDVVQNKQALSDIHKGLSKLATVTGMKKLMADAGQASWGLLLLEFGCVFAKPPMTATDCSCSCGCCYCSGTCATCSDGPIEKLGRCMCGFRKMKTRAPL